MDKYRKYIIDGINYDIYIKNLARSFLNEECEKEESFNKSYDYFKEIYTRFKENYELNIENNCTFQDVVTIIQLFLVYIKPSKLMIQEFKLVVDKFIKEEEPDSWFNKDLLFNSDLEDSILSLDLLKIRSAYIDEACNNMDENKDYEISDRVYKMIKEHSFDVYNENGNIESPENFKLSTIGKYHIMTRVQGIHGMEYGNLSLVENIEIVKTTLSIMTFGLSDILDYGSGNENEANCYIIGGSLVSCIETLPKEYLSLYNEMIKDLEFTNKSVEFEFQKKVKLAFSKSESDIDLIVTAPTIEMGIDKLKSLVAQIKHWLDCQDFDYRFVRTPNSITIIGEKFRAIQIITLFSKNVEEHLIFCDIDCTAICYNGKNAKMIPRSAVAFNNRTVLVTTKMERSTKYSTRGFECKNFEYCKHLDRCIATKSISEAYEKYSSIPFHHVQYKPISRILSFLNNNFKPKFFTKSIQDILSDDLIGRKTKFGSIKNYLWKISCLTVNGLISCYICKKKMMYSKMDIVPSSLCNDCIKFNDFHRTEFDKQLFENSELLGTKYALVTGARIKIGFECAVLLLEYGFNVIATTRFPHLANQEFVKRFSSNPKVLSRLHIYGLDFRNINSVQEFINHIKFQYKRIDILINNAAQTIRRPRAYYNTLLKGEKEINQLLLENKVDQVIDQFQEISSDDELFIIQKDNDDNKLMVRVNELKFGGISSTSIIESVLLPEDQESVNEGLFPLDKFDQHGEPLDMRNKTSWSSQITEISTVEMGEVNLVNTIVPTMLISQLVPIMERQVENKRVGRFGNRNNSSKINRLDWGYIANVTSSEGDFDYDYNNQSGLHAHTNMCKAALNMLTRTTATSLEKKNIIVYSPNTGWVSDMGPTTDENFKIRSKKARRFYPVPLTCLDGAARVLHPIFNSYFSPEPFPTGQMFVNYKIKPW